jgi:hypothetical protein
MTRNTAQEDAVERAREYRAQADAYRRLAEVEPHDPKHRLLMLSAEKYGEAADEQDRLANELGAGKLNYFQIRHRKDEKPRPCA